MKNYADIGGDSGISQYETGADYIDVLFKDGSLYRYTAASAGPANLAQMKELALSGNGLNAFINRNVKKGYSARLR